MSGFMPCIAALGSMFMLKIARLELGESSWKHSGICSATAQVIDILIRTEQGHPMSPKLFKVYIQYLRA